MSLEEKDVLKALNKHGDSNLYQLTQYTGRDIDYIGSGAKKLEEKKIVKIKKGPLFNIVSKV